MKKQIKQNNNIEKQIKRIHIEQNKCASKYNALKTILDTQDKKKILGGYNTFRKCQRLFCLVREYRNVLIELSNHLGDVSEKEKNKIGVAKID